MLLPLSLVNIMRLALLVHLLFIDHLLLVMMLYIMGHPEVRAALLGTLGAATRVHIRTARPIPFFVTCVLGCSGTRFAR